MGKAGVAAVVLDAGALMAFERANPKMRALFREALRTGARLVIPAGVLGQVWRDDSRQVPLRALLKGETTAVPVLDQVMAQAAGVLCARTRTTDVIDATVVLTAKLENAVVLTSDVDDMHRLDPTLAVERI